MSTARTSSWTAACIAEEAPVSVSQVGLTQVDCTPDVGLPMMVNLQIQESFPRTASDAFFVPVGTTFNVYLSRSPIADKATLAETNPTPIHRGESCRITSFSATRKPCPKSRDKSDASGRDNIPRPEPAATQMPSHAVTSGRFSAWTEPASPKPGQPYRITCSFGCQLASNAIIAAT